MKPPSRLIRSYSSSRVETLWSFDRLIAWPFQLKTALASPIFAQYILLDIIKQMFAVAPHL